MINCEIVFGGGEIGIYSDGVNNEGFGEVYLFNKGSIGCEEIVTGKRGIRASDKDIECKMVFKSVKSIDTLIEVLEFCKSKMSIHNPRSLTQFRNSIVKGEKDNE